MTNKSQVETYGIFKHLCTENAYGSFAKTLNSVHCTQETRKSIKRIIKNDIIYAHMAQLIICDGTAYMTSLQNTGGDGEVHTSNTSSVVLSVFSVDKATSDDFDADRDVEIYSLGSKGDSCAGYDSVEIFKDNSMCLIGDTLYICFSFMTADRISRVFCKKFNIRTKEWVGENKVDLRYRDQVMDFSDASLNVIYKAENLPPRAGGLIEMVSDWSEYKGEYYATGVTGGGPAHGFVVKTKDFCTMDFVDPIAFNDMGTAEVSSYIYHDKLYVACRQNYGLPYLYLSALDLTTMKWDEYYKVHDGNSRPWVFEYKDELYLWNTVSEASRRYSNISLVRTMNHKYRFYNEQHPLEIMATLKDCGRYFATAPHNGDIYFVAGEVPFCFGKLCLDFYDEETVNQKLLKMFNK